MGFKGRFETAKHTLLSDVDICQSNRDLFKEFFDYQEYKLKRTNGLPKLDEGCYKTLYVYTILFKNTNEWFKNKPWKDLTRDDIKQVYDALEDGTILTRAGKPFKDRASYYNKVFKSKPFRIAGKSELAKEVIEFAVSSERDVRFVTEETFRKMISVVSNPTHLLLFWLAWDIGENISSLLQLTRREFARRTNSQTREAEYLVNLPKSKLKRSRQSRSEPTLYPETVRYADFVLANLRPDDLVFEFGHRQALKLMHAVVRKSGATCMPNNEPVTWKDLRSGMASHLLKSGWSREEVDARLGHVPNSSALNAYINFLAIDREKPKKRLFDSSLEDIKNELEESRRREKLLAQRLDRVSEQGDVMSERMRELGDELAEFRKQLARASKVVSSQTITLEGRSIATASRKSVQEA